MLFGEDSEILFREDRFFECQFKIVQKFVICNKSDVYFHFEREQIYYSLNF